MYGKTALQMTSKENRRSPRYTPASQVSVMLYRDNARPRGCYVGNYSKHGVILKCSTLETDIGEALKVGDEVSLHFWDRGEPGHSIKVSGHIVRFDENQVAIEYASTSSASLERLLTLLDQRVHQTLAEEDTVKDLPKLRLPDRPRTKPVDETDFLDSSPTERSFEEDSESAFSPGLLLALLVVAVLGIVGVGLYSFTLSNQLDELSKTVSFLTTQELNQDDAASVEDLTQRMLVIEDLTQRIATIEDLTQRIATIEDLTQRTAAIEDLTQRIATIEDLTQRVVVMEDKQQDVNASLSEMVKKGDLQAAVQKLNAQLKVLQDTPALVTPETTRATQSTAPVSAPQQSWVIHLAALSDEGAVDKFISKAQSLGIDVEKERITVNDKQLFRLSISGLTSYAEAEKLANDVQKKLALRQKPWIARQ